MGPMEVNASTNAPSVLQALLAAMKGETRATETFNPLDSKHRRFDLLWFGDEHCGPHWAVTSLWDNHRQSNTTATAPEQPCIIHMKRTCSTSKQRKLLWSAVWLELSGLPVLPPSSSDPSAALII